MELEYSLNHLHRCFHLTLHRITSLKAQTIAPPPSPKRRRKKDGIVGAVVGGVGAVVGGVGAMGGAVVGGVVAVGGAVAAVGEAVVDGVGAVGGAVGSAIYNIGGVGNDDDEEDDDDYDDDDEFEKVGNEYEDEKLLIKNNRMELLLKQIVQSYALGCRYLDNIAQNISIIEMNIVSRMYGGRSGIMKLTATDLFVKAPMSLQLTLAKNMTLFGFPLPVPSCISIEGQDNGMIAIQVSIWEYICIYIYILWKNR